MEINEKLRAAADRAYAVMSTPDVCDICPERSPEYTRRLEKLVSKADSSRLWKLYNTGGRRAAALFITALLLISASLSVKAIREPVLELFANVFDTHTKFETSAAESSPPRELEVNNKASSAALTSYLSFEDSLRWATDYIEGRYISCEIKNHICYCTFEVIKDIRGNGLSGTVEVQYMPFDNIRLNDIDALYNDVPFTSLMTYLIPLCRYTDVYDENDIFSFAGDDLIIPSFNYKKNATLQGTELREHIKTQDALEAFENGSLKEYILDSIKDNPRCLGAPYTESTNIKDIIAFSDHVIKVRVEEPHSNFFDVNRISCTCVVEDVLKGDLETNSEVMVVFPEGKVEQERSYIIAVCENGSSSFLVMSSKNSVFDCSQYNSIKDLITNEETESDSIYFGSVMTSDGGSIEFDSLSLVPEVITFIEAEHEGEQIDFTMNGITHTYEYLFTWNVDTLPGPVLDYTYREEGKPSVGLSIMSDYPEFINWTDEEFDGLEGDFDDESLEFALATISERYGEDVSGYQMFFDSDNAKSVVVSKDVDGLKIKIGRCAVRETEDGYKIQSLLVFPKRLLDKFHLKYTIDEIKEIVESELAAKYPGSKVNSVLIGNSKYNNTYMYLVAKETWAYAFFINATIVREDGDEITTDIGCYIPFDIDE